MSIQNIQMERAIKYIQHTVVKELLPTYYSQPL